MSPLAYSNDNGVKESKVGLSLPEEDSHTSLEPIAIVGMGCRLPGGISHPSQLWDFLSSKRTGLRDFDHDRLNIGGFYHPNYQRPGSIHTRGAFLLDDDPRLFDHTFFGMNPIEVMTMDPLQRKILEVVYEAFESSGEPWDKFSGSCTGVFIGNFNSDHSVMQMRDIDFPLPYSSTGGSSSSLSNRVNHLLNLKGPSMTIDTACASSMYALHFAVNSLRNGDCESAIVGGSNLIMGPEMQMLTVKLGALSPTSTCHTFDASADGYGRAEGFGALYLKKYSDAVAGGYPIRALIRGTAVNANGRTAGISHPSTEGQERLIRQAYKNAGLSTRFTGYFECHGTGTPVGDPVEVSAIGRVFSADRKESPLLIGSVKTNLGHAEPTSGIIGVIKSVLALEKGIIPPTVGVHHLNPNIDFDVAGVKVVTEMTPWPKELLKRVSVNSFGYGGANAHCIIDHESVVRPKCLAALTSHIGIGSTVSRHPTSELHGSIGQKIDTSDGDCTKETHHREPIVNGTSVSLTGPRRLVLLAFSAHDEESLKSNISAVRDTIFNYSLHDLAYTLSRRSKYPHKAFFVVESVFPAEGLNIDQISPTKSLKNQPTRIGFIFTGQGAQWQNMGIALMEYGVFRNSIRTQDYILGCLSFSPPWKLEDILSGTSCTSVQDPEISQTICTALQIGLVDLFYSWNITPNTTLGHSSGEIAAAYASGYMSLAESITTAYCRGKSVVKSRKGLMMAVGLSVEDVLPLLSEIESEVKIAAINSPESITLSGEAESINRLHERLQKDSIFVRLLQTGGNAHHSHHMAEVGEEYVIMLEKGLKELEQLGEIKNSKCYHQVEWISSVTPYKKMNSNPGNPTYWRQNLESPVYFSQAVEILGMAQSVDIVIEIGPHSALQSPLKQTLLKVENSRGIKSPSYLPSLKRNNDGMADLLRLCGSLFCLSYPIDLAAVNSVDKFEKGTVHYIHGKVCTDLPTYRYKYGPPIYYENRISKEIKKRKHLRHDLLGVIQAGCAKEQPAWRNILRIKDVPWLKDHQILPDPVLPASGYVCLAIEAASQFLNTRSGDKINSCFKLRNISIKTAMRIPDDDIGLEMMLNLQHSGHSQNWLEFKVSSVDLATDTWTEHASGLISQVSTPLEPLDRLNDGMDARIIDVQDWYQTFTDIGLGYGKPFQGLSELLSDPERNISTAKIMLNTTQGLFKGSESSYMIHPASLDICHQLALIASHGGQTERVKHAFIPVFIDEMTVWPDENDEEWGQGVAVGHLKGLRGVHGSVQLFNKLGNPRLQITNLRCISHYGGKVQNDHHRELPSPYTRLVWKPDLSSLSYDQAIRLFPPKVPLKTIQDTFDIIDRVSSYMIVELAQVYSGFTCKEPHLCRFLRWVNQSAAKNLAYIEEGSHMTRNDRLQAIDQNCLLLGNMVDIRHAKRIFDNIADILEGTKTGVEISIQDGTLAELYTSGIGISGAYPQFERLLDLASHRNPSMSILEIGGGTGAATRVAMHTLAADTDSKWYKDYMFTDVSSAFLKAAESEFAQCKRMSYKTLDFNQCPIEQGFKEEYDLIIASECLHSARNVPEALRNVRKLLRRGGKMIMLETTRPLLGHGLAHGTFPDYWPESHHQESPFMTSEEWEEGLRAAGFSGIDIELDDYEAPLKVVSTIVTTAIDQAITAPQTVEHETVHVVYYRHTGSLHDMLTSELLQHGITPVLQPLDSCKISNGSRVIFTVDLEFHVLADGGEQDFEHIKELIRQASSILWLTEGGLLQGHDPKAAISTGLIRMLITENASSKYGIYHLEPGIDYENCKVVQQIVQQESYLHKGETEKELALHNGISHVSRLIMDHDLNKRYRLQNSSIHSVKEMPLYGQGPMVADFKTPGILTSLYFRRDESFCSSLNDDWIEIKTCGIGLNWKDLAVSAGKIDLDYSSSECSGIVTQCGKNVKHLRPGDRVYSLAWGNFGTSVRVPASFAQLMSPSDSFTDMATVPIVFCTAVYALKHLAHLQKGERILIQTATGGMGLAAIQIAQSIGAEVYATVGTEDKVQHLCNTYGIERERILSSRDPADVKKVMLATANRGFDVILSSSNGDMLQEIMRCIAPRGRLIDVGRVDVQNHSTMAMEVFLHNATFSSFDLSILASQEPEFCSKLMEEVGSMLRQGTIHPISPINKFDISELDKAILHFSKGQHIGKIVITYEERASVVKMIPPPPHAIFDPESEYILAGGLGGLGRSTLQWMVTRGAKNLTVFSRSGTQTPEAATMIARMKAQDVRVEVTRCDVTVENEVKAAIEAIAKIRPIRGILHAAAILSDRLFDTLPYSQWKSGLAAKVQGTLNLHNATVEHRLPLDFFIMTSSFEAVVAMPTQAAYCAANSFQDAFARYRMAQGYPACSIAFGLITEIGEFGQRYITRNMIRRHGLYPTGELSFLRLLEAAFLAPPSRTSGWRDFDPLAESQITTCLEPSKLAKMAQVKDRSAERAPRWYSDKKFSHLFQAMEDHITLESEPPKPKAATSIITTAIDANIKAGKIEESSQIITKAIMERSAELLAIPLEKIEATKSIAEYGMDSLIAVELRNWFVILFESAIPLLKILDERVSINELAAWIVKERQVKLDN